jgi:hypothetical protein
MISSSILNIPSSRFLRVSVTKLHIYSFTSTSRATCSANLNLKFKHHTEIIKAAITHNSSLPKHCRRSLESSVTTIISDPLLYVNMKLRRLMVDWLCFNNITGGQWWTSQPDVYLSEGLVDQRGIRLEKENFLSFCESKSPPPALQRVWSWAISVCFTSVVFMSLRSFMTLAGSLHRSWFWSQPEITKICSRCNSASSTI